MVGLGIVIATVGYTVVYYGAELWAGRAVSIASASGFAPPPAPTKTSGNSGALGLIGQLVNSPLLHFL